MLRALFPDPVAALLHAAMVAFAAAAALVLRGAGAWRRGDPAVWSSWYVADAGEVDPGRRPARRVGIACGWAACAAYALLAAWKLAGRAGPAGGRPALAVGLAVLFPGMVGAWTYRALAGQGRAPRGPVWTGLAVGVLVVAVAHVLGACDPGAP